MALNFAKEKISSSSSHQSEKHYRIIYNIPHAGYQIQLADQYISPYFIAYFPDVSPVA